MSKEFIRRCFHSVFKKYLVYSNGDVLGPYGKILKPELTKGGYHRITFSQYGKVRRISVHRVIAEMFIPNPQMKPQVNHLDGDKLNNDFSNLEWATSKENVAHCIKNGLQVLVGKDNPCAKLTDAKVRIIRASSKTTVLAKRFGVSNTLIKMVRRRAIWKHLA